MALSLSQNLCTLQKKLEEQEAALLGRTQVVELLQQELHTAEKQNQVPGHTFYCFTLCVCAVDGTFVSGSEVTRLGLFWYQLSIVKSAGVAIPGSGIRAAGLCAQLTAGTGRQWVLQLPALMIQGRWTGSTSIRTHAADCTFKAKYTNLCQKQKCITQCCRSLTVSGLQCQGQIRAETAILWYGLLRTCLYGDATCGVGLALTSSVWNVKKDQVCVYMTI